MTVHHICDSLSGSPGGVLKECWGTEIIEALDSRRVQVDQYGSAGYELHLYVQGPNDECVILNRLRPGQRYGLPLTFPDDSYGDPNKAAGARAGVIPPYPLESIELECIGHQLWEVRVKYAWHGATLVPDENVEKVPTNISMSTRGGNVRVTKSIKTVDKFPAQGSTAGVTLAADLEGAIEWDGNSVKGINIPTSITRYSESWIFPRSKIFKTVTTTEQRQDTKDFDDTIRPYRKSDWGSLLEVWEDYTGTVHGPVRRIPPASPGDPEYDPAWQASYLLEPETQRSPFRNWKPGTVLLENVAVRQVAHNHFEVTFDFLIRREYQETLPDSITDVRATTGEIQGWDHLWYYYHKTKKETDREQSEEKSGITAPEPKFGYVERTIERRDFIWLGVGINRLLPWDFPIACKSQDLMKQWNSVCRPPAS